MLLWSYHKPIKVDNTVTYHKNRVALLYWPVLIGSTDGSTPTADWFNSSTRLRLPIGSTDGSTPTVDWLNGSIPIAEWLDSKCWLVEWLNLNGSTPTADWSNGSTPTADWLNGSNPTDWWLVEWLDSNCWLVERLDSNCWLVQLMARHRLLIADWLNGSTPTADWLFPQFDSGFVLTGVAQMHPMMTSLQFWRHPLPWSSLSLKIPMSMRLMKMGLWQTMSGIQSPTMCPPWTWRVVLLTSGACMSNPLHV